MKSKLYTLLLFMLFLMPVVHAAQSPPCAVYIILDPSWSCEHKLDDFRSLARQISVSLKSGDYMEILSAGTTNPKVCLAQYIGQNPRSEFHEIQSALDDINSSMFYDASISRSVSTSIARSKRLANPNFNPKVIFVFTDGKLKPTDLQQMKTLYPTLEHENIELYLTGKQSSDRELLIAGNQEKLHFFLIHEANPAQWLKKRRPIILEEKSTIPAVEIPVIEQVAVSESKTDVEIKHRSEVEVKVKNEPVAEHAIIEEKSVIEGASDTVEATVTAPDLTEEPNIPQLADEHLKPTVGKQPTDRTYSLWKWILLALLLFGLTVGLIVFLNIKDVRQWSKTHLKKQKKSSVPPAMLTAKVQDRTYNLGRLEQMRQVHIGSGPNNSVRIDSKTVSPRHLRLYTRRSSLMLKNIGASAVTIQGKAVRPRSSCRLILPTVIQFDTNTSIALSLIKPKAAPTVERRESNDNAN